MMFAAGLAACAVALVLALIRAMRGPTPFDRLLAVNAIGTTVILGIALHGYVLGRPEFWTSRSCMRWSILSGPSRC